MAKEILDDALQRKYEGEFQCKKIKRRGEAQVFKPSREF